MSDSYELNNKHDPDAEALWQDVLALLEEHDLSTSLMTMLKSCHPVELTEKSITVTTRGAFIQRKVVEQSDLIESCIEQVAFQSLQLIVCRDRGEMTPVDPSPTISLEEYNRLKNTRQPIKLMPPNIRRSVLVNPYPDSDLTEVERSGNPLFEAVPIGSSKLTFDRFVAGEENMLALEAAKQVANGENKSYNPLFIYGRSGLGKTHLLRAIQNYIADNDPERLCVYRTAADFVDEYVQAVRGERSGLPKSALAHNYQNVDVLIIYDVQSMSTAAGTIRFFFETFNYLTSHGRQVVLAADRSPSQLGMGESNFDERDTSRMDSGVTVSIQVPDYELKLNLITTFYERMKIDAREEHITSLDSYIPDEILKLMAEEAGSNIRIIEGFVQSCLLMANQRERIGEELSRADVQHIAAQRWPEGRHVLTVEQIQRAVEVHYDIVHAEMVGSKRNKELMEPRHVAIWLSRQLTDNTLADIGKQFGGRSHATVKHSLAWVDNCRRNDKHFQARIDTLAQDIRDSV